MSSIKQPHRRTTRWFAGALPFLVAALVTATAGANASLNGSDPYRTGCARGATVAGSDVIRNYTTNQVVGSVYLMWSPRCQTNWGIAYFNDGNKATDPPVDILVFGTDPTQPDGEDDYNVDADYYTTMAGSPIWGNQVFSPGCAEVWVTWGNAGGLAIQKGCPVE